MIIKSKYRIAKVQDRTVGYLWVDNNIQECPIITGCFVFLPEVFDDADQADEFRSLKDYPEDYLIFRVW